MINNYLIEKQTFRSILVFRLINSSFIKFIFGIIFHRKKIDSTLFTKLICFRVQDTRSREKQL